MANRATGEQGETQNSYNDRLQEILQKIQQERAKQKRVQLEVQRLLIELKQFEFESLERLPPDTQQILDQIYKEIHDNFDQEKAERIYNSCRDYIKHEDTLGNARINILIASQSFLF